MRIKRLAAILASLAMATTLVSCGDKNEVSSKGEGGVSKLSYFCADGNAKPIDIASTPVGKAIAEVTGVEFKTEYLVGTDAKTKASLFITSGDMPDLLDVGDEKATYRDAGVLVPLDDYIEKYGENIKKAYGADLEMMRDEDGHIYTLSPFRRDSQQLYPGSGFYLPKEVLEANDYKEINTLDEYFDVIEKWITENPTTEDGATTIGFSTMTDGKMYLVRNVPSYLAGYPNTGEMLIDENYNARSYQLDDSVYKYYKKLNELWNKGLIDKEMFTQTQDQYLAKLASGRIVGFYGERWIINDVIASMEQQGMYDKVPFALPIVFEGVEKDPYNGLLTVGTSGGIAITTSCKDPEAAFKLLDAMASEEVQKLINWGIEGEDYTVDESGRMYLTNEQLANREDSNYNQKRGLGLNSLWAFPHNNFGSDSKYSDGNYVSICDTPEYIESKYKDYEKEVLEGYEIDNLSEIMAPAVESKFGYGWDITIPDSESEIKVAEQKSIELQDKYCAKLVTCSASEFDSIWEEYNKEMTSINYNIGEEFRTKEIKRRVELYDKVHKN